MPSKKSAPRQLSGLVVGVCVTLVVLVIGFIGWKVFAGPAEPMAGMSVQQKAEAIKKARGNAAPAEHRAF
jgi:hypothetical protein